MATEKLLHVASPRECNMQQTGCLSATARATGMQQPSLKALSGAVLGRNNACNSHATSALNPCNNMSNSATEPVALPTLRDQVELEGLITVVATFHAFSAADTQEARTIAFGDVPAALTCFRVLAAKASMTEAAKAAIALPPLAFGCAAFSV